MAVALRLALWNANGLSSHRWVLQTFLVMHKIDIALISETHFTSRTVFRLPRYTVFHSIQPDDTAHGGAAVTIRSTLRHHEHRRLQTPELQAIAVHLEAFPWPLTVSAVYCPPRQAPSSATYSDFFRSLGPRFLVGGDSNAKHTTCGARLITSKGRHLLSAIRGCHGTYFSTGETTYWPTDHQRLSDLLDFFVARGIAANYIRVEPVFELSSDHSPILATVGAHVLPRVVPSKLTTNHTGTHFVPILPLTSTFTYGSSNEASWTTRRITLLPSFRTPLGTPLLPLGRFRRRYKPLPSTSVTSLQTNEGPAAGGNDRETSVIAPSATA